MSEWLQAFEYEQDCKKLAESLQYSAYVLHESNKIAKQFKQFPNTPQAEEKKMTREEARKICGDHGYAVDIIVLLEKFGVLKLEEPISVRDQAISRLHSCGWTGLGEVIVGSLERGGFKIVKDKNSKDLCDNS